MDEEIGGIPMGFRVLKKILPGDKHKRYVTVMAITSILTYVTYVAFMTTRVPMTMVQLKVIDDCNYTHKGENVKKLHHIDPWCEGSEFGKNAHITMVTLGTIFVGSYSLSLHLSGCIADYFNPRYYISAGCLFGCCLCWCLGLADLWNVMSVQYMATCLILLGVAESTGWPILLSCTTYWYTGSRQGLFFALWNTHSYVAAILGIYTSYSVLEESWGLTFIIPGTFLGIMSIFVFTSLATHPSDLRYLYKDQPKRRDAPATPVWMNQWASLDYSEAFRVPKMKQFSMYVFFARMASFSLTYWLPSVLQDPHKYEDRISPMELLNLPYVIGGILGGVCCGVLKDLYNKSALICLCFYGAAVPITALNIIEMETHSIGRILVNFLMGITVEGPYILVITSVSAELGNHPIIRRQHRGIATMAAIIESCGVLGATFAPFINYYIKTVGSNLHIFMYLIVLELCAAFSLARTAIEEYRKEGKPLSFKDYVLKTDHYISDTQSYF